MPSVPSVTMKGSILPRVIRRPWARPKSAPSSSAKAMPSATTATGDQPLGARPFMSRITQPAMSAAIEPTDRSIPPEMMTKHMPTAMMPMKAVRVRTFNALSAVAKSALSAVPARHSSISPTTGPKPCRRSQDRPAQPAREPRGWPAPPAAPAAGMSVRPCCMGDQCLL
jgi:hypothetical protein